MGKIRVFAAALLALALLCAGAAAQTLPGVECFSPGLVQLSALEAQGPDVTAEAEVALEKAMYARDLSVLGSMLSGTTIGYARTAGEETLTIARGGETLGVYALPQAETVNAWLERLCGVAILERVPLASIADWLEGLAPGDALIGGFRVSEAFALERTMSDDGTRLTKIVFTAGSIARGDEAPWTVTGFLRQPAGRAPKDTFELTVTQDKDNFFELSYSALRESEIATKNKKGTASVRTALKAAGKLAGSSISSRLTVTTRNDWTADGESLSEKITVTTTLTHQDTTPGRRMQRLNDVDAQMKHVIRLTTLEAGQDAIALSDEVTLSVTMDSNEFLSGSAQVRMQVGGEAAAGAADEATPGEPAPEGAVPEAITPQAIAQLAARIYRQLGESTREKIAGGL